MQTMLENQASEEKPKTSPLTILAGALVVVTLAVGVWLFVQSPESKPSPAAQANLPAKMSAEEAAYAQNIRITNVRLSRAENFIHQEVTMLNADAINGGAQPVQGLAVTVEFSDDLHQVVLRESRSVLGTPPTPLAPGQTRSFQISFDRVPSAWNMQQPSVQVSYLRLATLK